MHFPNRVNTGYGRTPLLGTVCPAGQILTTGGVVQICVPDPNYHGGGGISPVVIDPGNPHTIIPTVQPVPVIAPESGYAPATTNYLLYAALALIAFLILK